jgi:hypothetical protein
MYDSLERGIVLPQGLYLTQGNKKETIEDCILACLQRVWKQRLPGFRRQDTVFTLDWTTNTIDICGSQC